MRTQGEAFDRAGSPLPVGTPIRTIVDGVDYSDGAAVQNGVGLYAVLTAGNSKTNANVSDTPTLQEGANLGDAVIFAAGDFTAATSVFREVVTWSPGLVMNTNLNMGSSASTPQPLKIQGIVARPARGGNQFVFLCNPTAGSVSLSDYYLELDAPSTYHGSSLSFTGPLSAATTLREDLPSPSWLTPAGDALKLVYRNPRDASASAGGLDIVVDRIEYNETRGGTLSWEPGNTIMGDAPAPGPGRILQRDAGCTDTNQPSDFSLGIEPGLPPNGPPAVTITAPTEGQAVQASTAVTFTWTMSDDIFLTSYLTVWANVTIGNVTTPLLANQTGVTSVAWITPDLATGNVVFRVDVEDPFGAHATDARTFSLTRQSPLALIIAVLIAAVLVAFLILGYLRTRKREEPPPSVPPPSPPESPMLPPTIGPSATTPLPAAEKKVCPRCHTTVNAVDTTCFFCGYMFAGETPSPP